MAEVAYWLGIALLALLCVGALLTLVLGLPGTFLIVLIAGIYGWATGFAEVTLGTVGGLFALALLAEAIEFASAARGGGEGGPKPSLRITLAAIAGAIAGGLLGAPLFFGIGALFGAFAGAFAGAALAATWEGHDRDTAVRHGMQALRGRVLGFVVKSAIATAMTAWLIVTAL
jgi:uncharacterized protein YqgC (DUF456 family)